MNVPLQEGKKGEERVKMVKTTEKTSVAGCVGFGAGGQRVFIGVAGKNRASFDSKRRSEAGIEEEPLSSRLQQYLFVPSVDLLLSRLLGGGLQPRNSLGPLINGVRRDRAANFQTRLRLRSALKIIRQAFRPLPLTVSSHSAKTLVFCHFEPINRDRTRPIRQRAGFSLLTS